MTTIWHRIRLGAVLGLAAFALGCASAPKPEPEAAVQAPADGVTLHAEFHGAHISRDRLRDRLPSEN